MAESEAKQKPSLGERIYDVFLNKIVEAVVLFVVGIVWVACGGHNTLLEKLGWTDPVIEAVQEGTASQETIVEEEPQLVQKTVPATSTSPIVGVRNVGFVRKSKYFGASSEFIVLEPGKHEAPFTEVRAGTHTIKWSAHLQTSENGYFGTGFGGEKAHWQVIGTAEAEFEQNSLYALLEDGEEDFLPENLQPLFVEAADEAIKEVNLIALRDELTASFEPREIANEEEPEFIVENEEEIIADESQYDQYLKILLEKATKIFDDKYSVKLKKIGVSKIVELKNADLSDPHLDDATAPSMFRQAKKSTVSKVFGSSTSNSGGGGGILGTIAGFLMIGIIFLIMVNFAGFLN